MPDEKGRNIAGVVRHGPASFSKEEKLRLLSDFDYVRANAAKKVGRYMILLVAPPRTSRVRSGFVCSRKFSGKAVVRNRAKRMMKEVFRNSKSAVEPCEMIFIPRQHLLNAEIADVQRDFIRLAREAGKWKGC